MQFHSSIRPKVRYLQVFTNHFIAWRWIEKKQVKKEIELSKDPACRYIMKIFMVTDKSTVFDFAIEKEVYDPSLHKRKSKSRL